MPMDAHGVPRHKKIIGGSTLHIDPFDHSLDE